MSIYSTQDSNSNQKKLGTLYISLDMQELKFKLHKKKNEGCNLKQNEMNNLKQNKMNNHKDNKIINQNRAILTMII